MGKMIAYCGLDCEKCDAYLATIRHDEALREKTAELWSELNHTPITPDQIYCEGCRADGMKTAYCEHLCAIRKCAVKRSAKTCGACPDMGTCPTLKPITEHNSSALENLKADNER